MRSPDGAGGGGQRFEQPFEHFAVERRRWHVRLAQPRHLVEAAAEFTALLFDDLHVYLGIRTDAHGSAS